MVPDAYYEILNLVRMDQWLLPLDYCVANPPKTESIRYEIIESVNLYDDEEVELYQNESYSGTCGGPWHSYGSPWSTIIGMLSESNRQYGYVRPGNSPEQEKESYQVGGVFSFEAIDVVQSKLSRRIPERIVGEIAMNLCMVVYSRLHTTRPNTEIEDVFRLLRSRLNIFGWIGNFPEDGHYAVHRF